MLLLSTLFIFESKHVTLFFERGICRLIQKILTNFKLLKFMKILIPGGGLAWSTYNFNFNLRKKWLLRENKVVGGAAPPLPDAACLESDL